MIIGATIYYFAQNSKKDNLKKNQLTPINKPSEAVNRSLSFSSNRSIDDQEESLITITISSGRTEQLSSNKVPGRWIQPGEIIKIKHFETKSGLFYFGGKLTAYQDNSYYNRTETEASLVDDSLPIINKDQFFTDDSLDYWPKYIELSPAARGAYLSWLCSDRNHPETPIGYVFIYFYGLERRILVDGTQGRIDDSEYVFIFNELKRLRQLFNENYAFHNYASKLIDLMAYLKPNIIQLDYAEFSTKHDSILFKYELAKQVHEGNPISPELALLWINHTDEYNLRTPARRCLEEFKTLFKNKYLEVTNGSGMIVKANKTRLRLDYYPASSTLRGFQLDPLDLPDPSILKAPIKKLAMIADQCTYELEQYSRYLGRKDSSKENLEALLLLPKSLLSVQNPALLDNLQSWADNQIEQNQGLISFKDLWAFTGKNLPEKINKKEIDLLDNLLKISNLYYVPHIKIHKIKPNIDSYLVISHSGVDPRNENSISSNFSKLLLFIRLAVLTAQADTVLNEKERNLVNDLIDQDEKLSENEKISLQSFFLWCMNAPNNTAGLKQQIETMNDSNKSHFRKILIQIALADGKIESAEIKQLEKIYTMLGLDKSLIPSDLHQYRTQKNINKTSSIVTSLKPSFTLDSQILAQHEAETKEVQSLLDSIFSEDSIENEKPEVLVQEQVIENGLDSQHSELFEMLIQKEKWLRDDIKEICAKLNLMVEGAIETINDWAYDLVDAPVLEDDGDIYIDQDIVDELKGE